MTPVNGGMVSGILKLALKFILGLIKYFSLAILYAIGGVVLYAVWKFNPFSGDLYSILYLVGFALSILLSWLIAFRDKDKKKKGKSGEKGSWRLKKEDVEEEPKSWWQKRKEKKALALERAKEEEERRERMAREEEMRAQERRLEELRSERLREEIAREERLIDEYRQQSARSALNRYEETVAPYPVHVIENDNNYFGMPNARVENVNNYQTQPTQHSAPTQQNIPTHHSAPEYFRATANQEVVAPFSQRAKEEPKIYMSAVEQDLLIHEYSDRFEVYQLNGGEKKLVNVEYKEGRS